MSYVTNPGVDIEIYGKVYTLNALTFGDLEWLELKLRARAIEAARLSLSENATPREREEILAIAMNQANRIDIFTSMSTMLTPSNMVWILYRMALHSNPDISIPEISTWVRDKEIMDKIAPQLTLLMGVKKKSAEPITEPPTATANP